jgi:hypothetical protein
VVSGSGARTRRVRPAPSSRSSGCRPCPR